ncbi:hypothetical protein NEOLEDRAFT_1181537 [Neolentinus lepideus HHB14362 ss-1]|uniref:Uncharacterized protein n=1 Tax=Neolentinus lepideus HHB14362 ss-1 TaxID=1314782 RepID=A0A165PZD0_9AGAM|nr:hypothetical protein NEOLEDRAFT_1181537 [Neolentinus lepideus HHB14362 ss-1]
MLKRSRPITPPPHLEELPSLPLVPGPSSIEYYQRDVKRRRTAAPSLDGPSRGWERSSFCDEEDEEDWWQDENNGRGAEASLETSKQYQASNSLLHDLHAEYQHRMLFSPSPAASSRHFPSQAGPYSPQSHAVHLGKQSMRYLSDRPVMTEINGHLQRAMAMHMEKGGLDTAEEQRVRARYEESNRLLRSLFLSRRRESPATDAGPLS